MIAIDSNTGRVYEGRSPYGHDVWPRPVISLATVISGDGECGLIPDGIDLYSAKLLFREDSFDPVTRIRRGRLYRSPAQQPQQWYVRPHFFVPTSEWTPISLHGFEFCRAAEVIGQSRQALIGLGTKDTFTVWSIISVKRIITGEDLLTLKARRSLGVLPELTLEVPESARAKTQETVSRLADAAHRAGPESVIDRARDVAQWCVGNWLAVHFRQPGLRHEDLGPLAKKIPEGKVVLKSIDSGILQQRREGTRTYFKAETRSPLFPELRGLLEKTAGLLPTLQQALEPFQARIDCAFVYGSVARSQEHALSDVDLLVIGGIGLAELAPALRKAETRLGRDVNVTSYAAREFRRKVAANDHFLSEVLRGPKQFVKGNQRDLDEVIGKPRRPTASDVEKGTR